MKAKPQYQYAIRWTHENGSVTFEVLGTNNAAVARLMMNDWLDNDASSKVTRKLQLVRRRLTEDDWEPVREGDVDN
jgi:hypothetical protein